ncbi:unnamed protein product [Ilex paraguariensis]|uniref:Dynamin stalk domain-containing protein n=1 Tax=Ilex paraguariensis TaxID=185542 RepID=A0ABC8TVL0_9AQUA
MDETMFAIAQQHYTNNSPANQDIAPSDAIKLSRKVDPSGRSYWWQHPWVGIVNRSQADINKNTDMIAATWKECKCFTTSPEYGT